MSSPAQPPETLSQQFIVAQPSKSFFFAAILLSYPNLSCEALLSRSLSMHSHPRIHQLSYHFLSHNIRKTAFSDYLSRQPSGYSLNYANNPFNEDSASPFSTSFGTDSFQHHRQTWRQDEDPSDRQDPAVERSYERAVLLQQRRALELQQLQQRREPTKSEKTQQRKRHIPRRAMPHTKNLSREEAAMRAGYIIRTSMAKKRNLAKQNVVHRRNRRQQREPEGSQMQDRRRVRPLKTIRKIVHRSRPTEELSTEHTSTKPGSPNKISNEEIETQPAISQNPKEKSKPSRTVVVKNVPIPKKAIDTTINEPSNTLASRIPSPPPDHQHQSGSNRVTFKASREATHKLTYSSSISPSSFATLTDYMTQPVEQYSLLSFHDEDADDHIGVYVSSQKGGNGRESGAVASKQQARQRRWLVRRLNAEEAEMYINYSSSVRPSSDKRNGNLKSSTSEGEGTMQASNLFRLAVPLQPLIGWDLTPVIDLEVIPPNITKAVSSDTASASKPTTLEVTKREEMREAPNRSSKWEPLRSIRQRTSGVADDDSDGNSSPAVVKIRSLRVSLLSTQEEVRAVMSESEEKPKRGKRNHNRSSNGLKGDNFDSRRFHVSQSSNNSYAPSKIQEEAIGVVGKVEEWLRPHITFQAELSWIDGAITEALAGGDDSPYTVVGDSSLLRRTSSNDSDPFTFPTSTVTVKSTAQTSLTIPRLPSGILHATVPSAFLVKRLGATLTSKALDICLPRFLRQLERDYHRWLGVDFNADRETSGSGERRE
mmetsp:Transcript_6113/g.13385  ORF Transcript_6113/g.13385 Transcript_6113/m.13385 type:complete len:767 (+) Transcript_6113:232-2532(+)